MNLSQSLRQIEARPWLAAIDPRVKLAWLATISMACVWLQRPGALAMLCVIAALPYCGLRMPIKAIAMYAALLVIVVWSTIYSQALFYAFPTEEPLFTIVPAFDFAGDHYAGLHFHREGAMYGAGQSLRFVANLLAGASVALSTSPERLLAALVALRIPTSLSFMATAALRSLPMVLDEWAALRQSYRLRRGGTSHIRLREEWRLVESLIANTLRRAAALALAVRARGFDAGAPRTHFPPLRLTKAERAALAAMAIVWLISLGWWLFQWGETGRATVS